MSGPQPFGYITPHVVMFIVAVAVFGAPHKGRCARTFLSYTYRLHELCFCSTGFSCSPLFEKDA